MKNSEVNNKHKNKDRKLKNILSIWYLKRKILSEGILMKHRSIPCAHVIIQQWVVNHWKTYDPVVNLDKCVIIISHNKYT